MFRCQVLLTEEMCKWINEKIAEGTYDNVSQCIRACVRKAMKEEKENGQ